MSRDEHHPYDVQSLQAPALEWYETVLHEPGREQFSCQDKQETQQDMPKATQAHTSNTVSFQHEKHSVNAHQAAHETTR